MILLLDNYDSFTYNLVDYFGQLGMECQVFRNDDPFTHLADQSWDGLVISPGPEVPHKSNNLMQVLSLFEERLPILGICLGHQAIGEYYGAQLVHAEKPMHGKVSRLQVLDDGDVFNDLPGNIDVVRYNSLILKDVHDPLLVTAISDKGEVMALRHSTLPVFGVQFHPEAVLTEYGLKMLQNWLESSGCTV